MYQVTEDRTQLLRIHDICNIIHRIRVGHGSEWDEDDQRLFKQIWPLLNRSHILHSNLQVVKIPKRKFDLWLQMWQHKPDRFIEKSTQGSYNQIIEKGRIHFELDSKGHSSTLAAIVTTESNEKYFYHECSQLGTGSTTEFLIKGKRIELNLPIRKDLMDQIFGKSSPKIPSEKILKHLPTVLQGRLDLLGGTSIVKIKQEAQAKLILKEDGADVLLTLLLDSNSVNLAVPKVRPAMKLVHRANTFEVHTLSNDNFPKIVEILGDLPLESSFGDCFRLKGSCENMNLLYKAFTELKPLVPLEIDPGLTSIFNDDSGIQSTVMVREGRGWLDIHIQCSKGKLQIEDADIRQALITKKEFFRTRRGEWLKLNTESLEDLHQKTSQMGLDFGHQRITNVQSPKVLAGLISYPDIRVHESSQAMVKRLQKFSDPTPPQYPGDILKLLRNYQKEGSDFLFNRTQLELGCILADDMGLGKTLQVLAFLLAYRKSQISSLNVLVVCPASVISVWLNETRRFTPQLRIASLLGSIDQRSSLYASNDEWDALVGSYAVIRNDLRHLKTKNFDVIILDEAQQIKNPDAEVTRAVKSLHGKHRIVLTGTPLENKLSDLWSIVDFLNPGYLGSVAEFKERYTGHPKGAGLLSKKISPFMLRRVKSEVAPQLPPKTEETIPIPLSAFQQDLYERELRVSRKNLKGKSYLEILAAITRLRQICCHPGLLPNHEKSIQLKGGSGDSSSKLSFLVDHLGELKEEGHSALVFSQFTSMLAILEAKLIKQNFVIYKITGETPVKKRSRIVDDFQNYKGPAVFLLSLKAAGTGLTLTKADYVFLYDPWWNPAVENQAIDRTHRIGQDKPVIAYRLIASDTIEEKIMKLKEEKQQLFSQIIDGATNLPSTLQLADLVELLE